MKDDSDSPVEILRRHGLAAKKSWGQNFLSDPDVLSEIAEAAELAPGDPVVELGPGLGHLTRMLLRTGAKVTAVERDRDMVAVLKGQKMEGLSLVEANAAAVNFAEVAKAKDVTVIGNLPYHLSTPILFAVLDQRTSVKRAVFTLQKEVVVRLASGPGTRDYGILPVLMGLWFDIEDLLTLPARLFHPPPKVDSAVVRMTRLEKPRANVSDEAHFRRVVKASFAQRRKTILNSLKSDPSLGDGAVLSTALAEANVDAGRRAETLSVEEFAALADKLAGQRPAV